MKTPSPWFLSLSPNGHIHCYSAHTVPFLGNDFSESIGSPRSKRSSGFTVEGRFRGQTVLQDSEIRGAGGGQKFLRNQSPWSAEDKNVVQDSQFMGTGGSGDVVQDSQFMGTGGSGDVVQDSQFMGTGGSGRSGFRVGAVHWKMSVRRSFLACSLSLSSTIISCQVSKPISTRNLA